MGTPLTTPTPPAVLRGQCTVFFRSKAAAEKIAEANGGATEGFTVVEAKGRPDFYLIAVHDVDDDYWFLGYL